MNRLAGIIIAVLGVIITILSVLKIVPGITSTGVALILLGALMIGLSFVPKTESEDGAPMSTASTLINIFFSPTEVFQNLRRHPRWLVPVLIMAIMSGVFTSLFLYRLTPERVANYSIDKTLEMPMLANNEQAKAQIEAGRAQAIADTKNPVMRVTQTVNSFVGLTFLYAFLALVYFLFSLVMGGKINYWQAFSVAVYAAFPVAVIRFVLNSIILFLKDPVDIHPILGQSTLLQDNLSFLVAPADSPVLFTLLSAFSLMAFYWIWLNATGLKNAGERVSASTAWIATFMIFLIGVAFSVLMAALFGGFYS